MFHDNLKTLRKEKGFSQEQLAVRLNVTRQTVSKWENALSVPDAELLIQMADVFNVTVSDLLGKEIEVSNDTNEVDRVADELAKLNELLVTYGLKLKAYKKKMITLATFAVIIIIFIAIYGPWSNMWHNFGQNLYYLLNP